VTPIGRLLSISILLVGLGSLYPLQRWIDNSSPRQSISEETMFLSSGKSIKRMSLGLNALASDLYWIRTVQYFGRKVIDSGVPLSAAATKDLRMDLLAPLLDIVVTLDPQHIPAYRFGAIFLPERDMPAAIALVEKGIEQNPNQWRLYQDLGYIYWQAGKAAAPEEQNEYYSKSALWFEKGGIVAGAPWWMRDLGGLMRIKGGSRDAARAIYSTYLTSDDPNIRAQAVERMKQLRSLDELDAINSLIARSKEQKGECPPNLRVFAAVLQSININIDERGLPVDPDGFEYAYDPQKCKAELASESTVPR
jgi:tetratricopeptide (TPR) repeat protein